MLSMMYIFFIEVAPFNTTIWKNFFQENITCMLDQSSQWLSVAFPVGLHYYLDWSSLPLWLKLLMEKYVQMPLVNV